MDDTEDTCWWCGELIEGDEGPVVDHDPFYAAQFHVACVETAACFYSEGE